MRRIIGIIGISLALVAMHGGKWAAYAWCRVQMTVILQQADCDCAKVLSTADDTNHDGRDAAAGWLKPGTDMFGAAMPPLPQLNVCSNSSSGTPACTYTLLKGQSIGVFRPPASC